MVQMIDGVHFEREVLSFKGLVLVDFYANWCGPCQRIAPILEELSTEFAEKVKIVKIDVDQNQSLSMEYGVMSIPTLLLVKNGEAVGRIMGLQPKEALIAQIERYI